MDYIVDGISITTRRRVSMRIEAVDAAAARKVAEAGGVRVARVAEAGIMPHLNHEQSPEAVARFSVLVGALAIVQSIISFARISTLPIGRDPTIGTFLLGFSGYCFLSGVVVIILKAKAASGRLGVLVLEMVIVGILGLFNLLPVLGLALGEYEGLSGDQMVIVWVQIGLLTATAIACAVLWAKLLDVALRRRHKRQTAQRQHTSESRS